MTIYLLLSHDSELSTETMLVDYEDGSFNAQDQINDL